MYVYADGKYIGTDDNGWTTPSTFMIPCNFKVIAIKGWDTGGPAGIIGSFSNGLVTDRRYTSLREESFLSLTNL